MKYEAVPSFRGLKPCTMAQVIIKNSFGGHVWTFTGGPLITRGFCLGIKISLSSSDSIYPYGRRTAVNTETVRTDTWLLVLSSEEHHQCRNKSTYRHIDMKNTTDPHVWHTEVTVTEN